MGSIRLTVMEWDTWFRVRGTQGLRHLVFTDALVDMLNASTREPSQTFPDVVQEGLAVSVADTEACGKALEAFHKEWSYG